MPVIFETRRLVRRYGEGMTAGYEKGIDLSGANRHHQLFEGGIPSPFPMPFESALHLPCPILDGGKGIGNGIRDRLWQWTLKVTFSIPLNFLPYAANEFSELGRDGIAHGIRMLMVVAPARMAASRTA